MIRIGLISDTHGLLRPEAVDVLRGSDFIVHAGDIGEGILEPLSTIAPVTAVRGNNDRAPWAGRIAESEWLRFGEVTLHVLHDLADLAIDPKAAGVDVVVTGHSHRPKIERRSGVLYVNPARVHLVPDGDRRSSIAASAAIPRAPESEERHWRLAG